MKRTYTLKAAIYGASILTLCLLAGCAVRPPPPYQGYADRPKIPLKVALNVTDDLRKRPDSEDKRYPLEDSLAKNAPILVGRTFSDVVEVNNGNQPANPVDAILTPKVAYVGGTVGSKVIFDIKLEWTMADSKGNPIWIDTIGGWGYGSGNSNRKEVLKEALYSVLDNSQDAMWRSQAIRHYAQSRYSNVAAISSPNDSNTCPEVTKLVASLNSYDRDEVMRSLRKLREMKALEAVPPILRCLKNSSPDIQRECCRTLAVVGNRETIPYLEAFLTNPNVRQDAKKAIKKIQKKN